MRTSHSLTLVIVFATIFSSCEKDPQEDVPTPDYDRRALLTQLSGMISQAHSDHHVNMTDLGDKVNVFNVNPTSASLNDLRTAWRQTLLDWQSVAPYEFGEAVPLLFELTHNSYPVDAARIDQNISSGSYNLDAAINKDAIGLQAMDYLLHGTDDNSIISNFSGAAGQAHQQYLLALYQQMLTKSSTMLNEWQTGGQQTSDFIANDGTSVGSSIGLFLNAFNKSYEKSTRSEKLGIPAGALTFSMTPLPDRVEAYYENTNSVEYLRESIVAFRKIYLGDQGYGLDDCLIALNANHHGGSLDQAIKDQFDEIEQRLNDLQAPLSDFVVNDQQSALDVYAELQELVVLFKVDMMSALGVLITYQDNDGD